MNKMQYTLAELTTGLEVVIQGDANLVLTGICTIQEGLPNCIAFLMNPAYRKFLANTQAGAVILSAEDAKTFTGTAVVTANPYYVYAKIAEYFDKNPKPLPGIHPSAVIGKDCQISSTASVGPNSVIGDGVKLADQVVIGANCTVGAFAQIDEQTKLHANVTLYPYVQLGKRVLILSGAVIGSDGFGLAKHKGSWYRVPQIGSVIIEDDVEIGANTTIDRGAIEDTVISKGARLDNLIQVGHNVRIGANTAVAGCVGIAGSTTIGSNCMIGGGVGINGHITISDHVAIMAMSGVSKSITEPGIYAGGPIEKLPEWRKTMARIMRLKKLNERVKALEAELSSTEKSTITE